MRNRLLTFTLAVSLTLLTVLLVLVILPTKSKVEGWGFCRWDCKALCGSSTCRRVGCYSNNPYRFKGRYCYWSGGCSGSRPSGCRYDYGNCCRSFSYCVRSCGGGSGDDNGNGGGCNWNTKPTIPSGTCVQAAGLWGHYYRDNPVGGNRFDGGLKMERNDSRVNFNWGNGAPSGKLCPDHFSVKWTGYINLSQPGNWRFGITSDDGMMVDLEISPGNWQRVVTDWSNHGARTRWGGWRNLDAGWYGIRVWFYENRGGAVARLRFQGPGTAAQIVPSANLRTCYSPCAVTPPTSPWATAISPTSAQLNWTSGTGGEKQLLRLDTSQSEVENGCPGGCLIKEDSLKSNLQVYSTGSILEPGTRYFWRIVEYKNAGCWEDFTSTPSFLTKADPWTKVKNGDIHANSGINFSRKIPGGEYNGQYLISARGTINSNVVSAEGWICPLYPERDLNPTNNSGITIPSYDTFWKRFGQGKATTYGGATLPTGNGVYLTNGSHTLNEVVTFPDNRQTLIFINGNFTVNAEIQVPNSSAVTFIVNGSIRFGKKLKGGEGGEDEVGGIFIAKDEINTAYNIDPTEVTRKLLVKGALISLENTIYFNRNLGDEDNGTIPAETINLQPKHLLLLKSRLAKPTIFWREVAAGN